MVELPRGIRTVKAKSGKLYFYYHPHRETPNAGKAVRLPDDPRRPEFWAAYNELSGATAREIIKRNTFDNLISAYMLSPEFAAKAKRTKVLNERHLGIISASWGSLVVRGLRPRHVLELRDKLADRPRMADQVVSILSAMISWGIPREFSDSNPCAEIKKLSKSEAYAPWSWAQIQHAKQHLPAHLWHVVALALYSGQRQSDVLGMTWNRIVDDGVEVMQSKTRKRLWVPLHGSLRAILAEIPRRGPHILTNSRGLPWGSGFQASWTKAMNRPEFAEFRERRLVFHGLRKSSVCILLEAGATVPETAAITGQTLQMVAHYSLMVNQRKLATSAILKWETAEGTRQER
jgi:integrase